MEEQAGVNVEEEDHYDDGDDDGLAMMTTAFGRQSSTVKKNAKKKTISQSTVREVEKTATPEWDEVRIAAASRPRDDDAMSRASNATIASTNTTVSAMYSSHSAGRAEQRFIDFEDIKDAKVNGTVSLAICFDGEEDKIQVMGEIRMWADKIKHEPQFEDIVPCDTKVKGRDGICAWKWNCWGARSVPGS